MSRLRKKLQGKDMLAAMRDSDDDDVTSMAFVRSTAQSRKNEKKKQKKAMAVMMAPSDDGESDDAAAPAATAGGDDDEGIAAGASDNDDDIVEPEAAAAAASGKAQQGASKKKKNKGGKKKGGGGGAATAVPEPAAVPEGEDDMDDEDFDAILKAHTAKQKGTGGKKGKNKGGGKKGGGVEGGAGAADAEEEGVTTAPEDLYGLHELRVAALLKCDKACLDPDLELKRIFGADVLAAARAEQGQNEGRHRVRRHFQQHPAMGRAPKPTRFRPSILAKPDTKTWPKYTNVGYSFTPSLVPAAQGHQLGSKHDDPNAGTDKQKKKPMHPVFTLTESSDCGRANQMLETAVNAMSIEGFSQLLARFPYHIPILLRCSELASQLGQFSEAAEMADQALYAADMASVAANFDWEADFTERGLPYALPTNRPVFWAVEKKIQSMIKKGCHRTALEWCKLLLNLDPSDPSHTMLLMGYCAAKCGEWAWFLSFADALHGSKGGHANLYAVAQLPQVKYSAALCAKLLENAGGGAAATASSSSAPAVSSRSADALLEDAIRWYPSAVPEMLAAAKCNDPVAAVLASTAGNPPHTVERLVDLFTARYAELFGGVLAKWVVQAATKVSESETTRALIDDRATFAKSDMFKHYAQCERDAHMGRTTVIPEEALEDQPAGGGADDDDAAGIDFLANAADGGGAGLPDALRQFLANLPEEERGGGVGVGFAGDDDGDAMFDGDDAGGLGMSEAEQMLGIAEMEIATLGSRVDAALAATPAGDAAFEVTYRELNELTTRQLLFLDSIAAEDGGAGDAVRAQRRELVRTCHALVTRLDAHHAGGAA